MHGKDFGGPRRWIWNFGCAGLSQTSYVLDFESFMLKDVRMLQSLPWAEGVWGLRGAG